jgi:Protein of unknown function (DUF732)
MTMKRTIIAAAAAVAAMLSGAAPASADAQSYLAYIRDHQINTAFRSDAWLVKSGMNACDLLHSGMTVDQITQGLSFADAHGLTDAAQHELCPDTLR